VASVSRTLQSILAVCEIYVLFYRILPESIRWLQSQGRIPEVKKILLRAAKINGVTLSDQEFTKFELSPVVGKPEEVSENPLICFSEKFLFINLT
jgi:hypothetical protein